MSPSRAPVLSFARYFQAPVTQAKLKSSLISFAGSDSPSTGQAGDKRKRGWREGWGGDDYSRETIISNISIKGGGGDYSREAINRGTAVIRGNTVSLIMMITMMMIMLVMIKIVTEARGKSLIIKAY